MTTLSLDTSNLLRDALGSAGFDPARLKGDLADRFAAAHRTVEEWRSQERLGFLDLPRDHDAAQEVQDVADAFGQWFEDFVVLGIGGSALGARAVQEALLGLDWNRRTDEQREYFPRLHILDNVDPHTVAAMLNTIDLRRALFDVVSKSGATAETMAQYLVMRDRVAAVVDEDKVRGHFLFTTDPARGALRAIAEADSVPTLPIPPNVGGRFSVLSAAGLLPAAVTGVDIEAMLAGAADMEARCRSPILHENPAGLFATLLHASQVEAGRGTHVLMPYSDRLFSLGLWFQQLWAESLGKIVRSDDGATSVGPTPLAARGASDQHSLLQLFMEGPDDKVVVFLEVASASDDVHIPALHSDVEQVAYLGGHTLGELLAAERAATAEGLRRAGRPSLTLRIEHLDAHALGELFMFFQIATVQAGALYGVDPLDQPGVELGKRLTYGLMGRAGYERPEF